MLLRSLVLLVALTVPAAADPSPAPAAPRAMRATGIGGATLLGVGLASVVVGGAFAMTASNAYYEINTPTPGYTFHPETEQRLQLHQPLAIAFLTVGVAATATSVVVLLLSRRPK